MEQRDQQVPDPDRAGTPKHPIGRGKNHKQQILIKIDKVSFLYLMFFKGRPLPPPGQPLPFPEGLRTKRTSVTTPKRKPVPGPNPPQRRQDEAKARMIPRQSLSACQGEIPTYADPENEGGLLVVEAPPESEPSSPNVDKGDERFSDPGVEPAFNQKELAAALNKGTAPNAG